MNQEQKGYVIKSLIVALDMMGQNMSEDSIKMMSSELYNYDFNAVQLAIKKCTRECKYKINLAEIISRIADGRPTANEAWQEVYRLTENDSKVMTAEQQIAFATVSTSLIGATTNDLIVCKQAFTEKYNQLVEQARAEAVPIKYELSMGSFNSRLPAITEAIALGRMSQQRAVSYLPEFHDEIMEVPLLEHEKQKALMIENMAKGIGGQAIQDNL